MPDFASALSVSDPSLTDPYGQIRDDSTNPLRSINFNESERPDNLLSAFYDSKIKDHSRMSQEMQSTLKTLEKSIGIKKKSQPSVLTEETDNQKDDDNE